MAAPAIRLCASDQQKAGSCASSNCADLHLCRDFLLNNSCSEFESNGKCSRPHSLFTFHNQRIVKDNETAFDTVAKHVRSAEERSDRSDRFVSTGDDADYGSHSKGQKTSTLSSVLRQPPSASKIPFPTHLPATTADDSHVILTNSSASSHGSERFSSSLNMDLTKKKLSATKSLSMLESGGSRHRLVRFQDEDRDDKSSSTTPKPSGIGAYVSSSAQSAMNFVKGVFSGKDDSASKNKDDEQLEYIFGRYVQKEQLAYLFGPTRRYLLEKKKCQIFPSGYCRISNAAQEKDIEQSIQRSLPSSLHSTQVQLQYQELGFLLCTSAAERILQKQVTCGILSQAYEASLPIEVKGMGKMSSSPSSSASASASSSAGKFVSIRLRGDEQTDESMPVEKFRISKTKSSIDVIEGDITQTKVDLMVCVTTSKTLLDSALKRAGKSIEAEFQRYYRPGKVITLGGGDTAAQKILFIPWEFQVDLKHPVRAQESLAEFIRRCIDTASSLQVKSIAFPSIGAGEMGLSPDKVCEAMFAGAIDRLNLYKMDVVFVIYPPRRAESSPQPYQIFRNYLNDLCKESKSVRADVHSDATDPQAMGNENRRKKYELRRNVQCKNIFTVSDSTDTSTDHHALKDQLGRLIVTKKFDLRCVEKAYLTEVDLLIDVCMNNHVWPRVDLMQNELTLRGDAESCSQCFANLRNERSVYRYGYLGKTSGSNTHPFNVYMSLRIEEIRKNNETYIRIEDTSKTNYKVYLDNNKVEINGGSQQFDVYRERVERGSKDLPPSTWSSSVPVQTPTVPSSSYPSLDCVVDFGETMPKAEWRILEVQTIENWPLYVHYMNEKSSDGEVVAFHGCSFSSVQSIIHYGLHSYQAQPPENSIRLQRQAIDSHIFDSRRATDGRFYMFAVQLAKRLFKSKLATLTNEEAHLALPTHLIVYERR